MKSISVLVIVLLSSFYAAAQTPTPTPLLYSRQTISDMRSLMQAALSSDYAYRQTAYLSNNIGPRLTGSPQAERAVQYVAEEMRKLGLEVRLQELSVPHWVRGEERAALIEFPGMAPGTSQKIVITALGGSIATAADGLTGEIVVVNNFDELNALGREKVEGKIVLFNTSSIATWRRVVLAARPMVKPSRTGALERSLPDVWERSLRLYVRPAVRRIALYIPVRCDTTRT